MLTLGLGLTLRLGLGLTLRLGLTLGLGLTLRLGLTLGLGLVTPPVQVTPLRVNDVGTGLLVVHVPLRPGAGVTAWPVPTVPL